MHNLDSIEGTHKPIYDFFKTLDEFIKKGLSIKDADRLTALLTVQQNTKLSEKENRDKDMLMKKLKN